MRDFPLALLKGSLAKRGNKNPMWGKHTTERTKLLQAIAKCGYKNPMWKGDEVGYKEMHIWLKTKKSKPALCENCNEETPFDLANISGEYKRDINDYQWLCRKCHMVSDGRMNNLKNVGK